MLAGYIDSDEDDDDLDKKYTGRKNNYYNDEDEEEDDDEDEEDEEESSPSWKKSGSEDSGDNFQKPVDFGIEKETSLKIANLELPLNEAAYLTRSNDHIDSAPTTSRDLDSASRNYINKVTGYRDDGKACVCVFDDFLLNKYIFNTRFKSKIC